MKMKGSGKTIWALTLVLMVTVVGANMENNLVEDIQYPDCDLMLTQIPMREVESPQVLRTKDIAGKWHSQRCETRPGHIHVLRSYKILGNGKINLTLHIYSDASCSQPRFSVFVKGHVMLGRSSLVTPGATEAEYTIFELSLIPHSNAEILKLIKEINTTYCSASILKSLRPHHETTLYRSAHSINDVSSYVTYNCVPFPAKTWNEFQLFRVEEVAKPFCRTRELFLGDLHSNPSRQKEYRPTAYQPPLLNEDCIKDCEVCKLLSGSSAPSPPSLPHRPLIEPPKTIHGRWASTRCEVQRYGLFLTRKISFKSTRPKWSLKQRYFSDPHCRNASYTIDASGTYRKVTSEQNGTVNDVSRIAFDMTVRKMRITPEDKTFAAQLNRVRSGVCGMKGRWRKGQSQDVTITGGCSPIGLKVPSVEPEILLFESGEMGQIYLYLGQTPTWPHRGVGPAPRPTSFGPKLRKCSNENEYNNHLRPVAGARVAIATDGSVQYPTTESFLVVLFTNFVFNYIFQ